MRNLLMFIYSILPITVFSQWEVIPNAPVKTRFDDVSFINSTTGWMAQGYDLYKTTDGGLTWPKIATLPIDGSGYVRSIEFLNATTGFYGTLATSSSITKLYRTTDGGLTWTAISGIPVNPLDGICGMSHFGNLIIAAGTWSSFTPYIYKSQDGGNSWTTINMSAYANGLVDCHVFDNYNFLACGISPNNRAMIIRTSDGGVTWNQVAICNLPGTSYMWKMFFLPGGTGFASVQGYPVIYKTTDYGYTWTEINLGFSSAIDLGAIGALNDSVIWTGNQFSPGMYGTQDGGQTWTAYPVFGENMDRMALVDNNHLICVGKTVYRYTGSNLQVPIDSTTLSKHHQVTVRPNPTSDALTIKLQLYQSTLVLLDLFDQYGNEVRHLYKGVITGGETYKSYNIGDLPSGTYVLWFRSNEEHKSIKVVVQ